MAVIDTKKEWTLEECVEKFGHAPRPRGDDEHCAICNVLAPRVIGYDYRFYSPSGEPSLVVSLHGWAKIFYPWVEPVPVATILEHQNICPKCGKRVAEYIALLKNPGVTEHDL